MYSFNIIQVFHVMRDSPCCNIFLLYDNIESNLFGTIKIWKLEYNL